MENWEDLERALHSNKKRITSVEFLALFKKYDTDGKETKISTNCRPFISFDFLAFAFVGETN